MLDLKMFALHIVPVSVVRCGGVLEHAVSMPSRSEISELWKSLGLRAPYPREEFWAAVLREALVKAREAAPLHSSGECAAPSAPVIGPVTLPTPLLPPITVSSGS